MTSPIAGWRAVGELYHAYVTGLILTTVTRRSPADAAEYVFRIFRRQQLEKFLPGLEKLGLRGLPDAVACAQYHYLSNDVGGVRVEYMYESDQKAWVRYVPPRWIYDGATICAVPSDVTRAILRGWHANNGVLLGNDRLGFVCTKMTTEGQPGLEAITSRATVRSHRRNGCGSRRRKKARTSIRRARRGSTRPRGRPSGSPGPCAIIR